MVSPPGGKVFIFFIQLSRREVYVRAGLGNYDLFVIVHTFSRIKGGLNVPLITSVKVLVLNDLPKAAENDIF